MPKKRIVKKKRVKPKSAKPDQYFILVTGVPLKNLKELASALETMNDWVFNHHVNESRNDFAAWAKEVLNETGLSEEIIETKSIRELELKILKYLVNNYI
jgi:hypothetical protein